MSGESIKENSEKEELAQRIARLSPAKRALLELRLKKVTAEGPSKDIIKKQANRENAPLSFAQQRLWFLDQLEPGSIQYNIPMAWRLKGTLHVEALHRALNTIVERHASLRTSFSQVNGEPVQHIVQQLVLDFPLTDLSEQTPDEKEAEVKRLSVNEARSPFDLSRAPLVRCALIRIGAEDHLLLVTMHHIVSDGWSMDVLHREIWLLYEAFCQGRPSPLPELPIQYADFSVWQRQWFQGEILEKQLAYWKERLAGAPPVLELPADRPHPTVQSFRGATHSVMLSVQFLSDIKEFSRKAGGTLFMTLLAAFQLLLHRYTGQEDIVVGSPIAGRNRFEIENLIGFFVNTLVLRTDLSGNPTFKTLLDQVRLMVLGAFEHQDLPFEKLVEALKPERQLSHNPLVQVVFALQNLPETSLTVPNLSILQQSIDNGSSKFDLILFATETVEGLNLSIGYNTDLFDQSTIERMMGHFKILLNSILEDPEQSIGTLPILTKEEKQKLLVAWNDTKSEYPNQDCIHSLFESQVEKTPDTVAVVCGKQQLTYAELNIKANQMAHYLQNLGIDSGAMVGLCLDRSPKMIIGMLGILKAGGAYVPLDPSYPEERLTFMIEDTQINILLTEKHYVSRFPSYKGRFICLDGDWKQIAKQSKDNLNPPVAADKLAYVMYTSGSTGKPKGVCVIHRGVVRLVLKTNYIEITEKDVFLQFAPISFDASTFEIWGALLNGARLVLFPGQKAALHELGDVIKRHSVTILWLTAGLFHEMVEHHMEGLRPVKYLLAGGDVLSPSHVKKVLASLPECRFINGYGPTENTTFTCCHLMVSTDPVEGSVPIGKPISNTQVYILDDHLQPVPVGVPGELYIGGDGLATGYLNRPELTKEKFIPNPFDQDSESRLYRSGDLVRYRINGDIEFIGRRDNQIKLRGFRIELGEIENIIKQHPDIHELAAVLREDIPGDKRIVVYFVAKPDKMLDASDIRAFIRNKVPEYMVPSAFVPMDQLPLTQNGKIDRRALPVPDRSQMTHQESFIPPRDSLEIQIAKTWEKALGIRPVGVKNNFFELGGHSLLAVQVLSNIKKLTGKEIPVADLFKFPTVEQLADIIRSKGWSSPFSLLIPFQPLGSKPPFFCIHGAAKEAANLIGLDQPFYGGFPHGYFGKRVPLSTKRMASDYVREIREVQPEGPYYIGGYSFGGMLAFEMAHQLQEQGQEIALLALIDATSAEDSKKKDNDPFQKMQKSTPLSSVESYSKRIFRRLMEAGLKEKITYVLSGARNRLLKKTGIDRKVKSSVCTLCLAAGMPIPQSLRKFYRSTIFKKAARIYTPEKFDGHVVLFRATGEKNMLQSFWQNQVVKEMEVHDLPGRHLDLFKSPQVEVLAEKLKKCLEEVQKKYGDG